MMASMIGFRMILTKKLFCIGIIACINLFAKGSIDQIGPPWGYTFTDWNGPPLDIISYIPPNATADTPILIVIPGASRDAQRFHASWLDLAKKKNFSVLTVGAKKKYFPDEYSYNAGGLFLEDGEKIEEDKWLFSSIEPIFYDFKNRYGFKTTKFYMFGHSAGGGFVHRYLLFKPDAPIIKAAAANPAFVTLPDWSVNYPFGLKNSPVNKKHLKLWLKKNMAIVLGSEDLGPRTKPLSNGLLARKQGPNCLSRGKLLFETAGKKAIELSSAFNWEIIVVPNVGHDNYAIAPEACNYLFGE